MPTPPTRHIDIARKMEPYDIFRSRNLWRQTIIAGMRRLPGRRRFLWPLARTNTPAMAFESLIDHEAAAILNPDAQVLGGITEFMQVAALAAAHDLHIAPHGAQEVHVHLVTAIPQGLSSKCYRETVDPMRSQIFTNRSSSTRKATSAYLIARGSGIEPNYELLQRYRVC